MLASVAIDLVAERAPELVKYIAAWIVELFNLTEFLLTVSHSSRASFKETLLPESRYDRYDPELGCFTSTASSPGGFHSTCIPRQSLRCIGNNS